MKQFEIVTNPIEAEQYRTFTLNEHQGAVVVFTGHVREWTKGVKTEYLEYEAYVPMAQKTRTNWRRNYTALARNDNNDCTSYWSPTNL